MNSLKSRLNKVYFIINASLKRSIFCTSKTSDTHPTFCETQSFSLCFCEHSLFVCIVWSWRKPCPPPPSPFCGKIIFVNYIGKHWNMTVAAPSNDSQCLPPFYKKFWIHHRSVLLRSVKFTCTCMYRYVMYMYMSSRIWLLTLHIIKRVQNHLLFFSVT